VEISQTSEHITWSVP